MRTARGADPNAILAFAAVAETRSFRGAARALNVPKSTLSQRVAELESYLGARLLARTTRSVALTDVGASYHREVAPALEALHAAEQVVAARQALPSGRLRMTAPFELGQLALGDILATYVARHPEVKLEVDLTDRQVDLVAESYDLAVRVGPLRDSRFVARRLGNPVHRGTYASPSYLAQFGTPARPRDLARHRCLVMHTAPSAHQWDFRVNGRRVIVPITPVVSVNSFSLLATLVATGGGIARLPAPLVRRGLADKSIVEVLGAFALPARPAFAIYPSARNASPALKAMVALLVERFQAPSWSGH